MLLNPAPGAILLRNEIMLIRPVRGKSDLGEIADLFVEIFSEEPYKEKWKKMQVYYRAKKTKESGKGINLVAEHGGKIVGFVTSETLQEDTGKHLFIVDLGVKKEFRRQRVGSLLVKRLEKEAKKDGIKELNLTVNSTAKALKFWREIGYMENNYIGLSKEVN